MREALNGVLTSWIGSAFRHINASRGDDILDFRFAGLYGKNRWNRPGQSTLYLAGDVGVAIAEWGRQFPASYPDAAATPNTRIMFRLRLRLDRVLDLRNERVAALLNVSAVPEFYQDVEQARLVATRARTTTSAQAMLVPSIAFPDDLTRWNLVVFLDKMPTDTSSWITRVERLGPLAWNPD